jgi:hypothetical protein
MDKLQYLRKVFAHTAGKMFEVQIVRKRLFFPQKNRGIRKNSLQTVRDYS